MASPPAAQPVLQPAPQPNNAANDIFDRIVTDRSDLVGLIAYGLYWVRRAEWIEEFRAANGRVPSEQEKDAHAFGFQNDAVNGLKNEAKNALYRVVGELVERQTAEMQRNAFYGKVADEFAGINRKLGKISGYRHHIVGHIAGFFFTSIVNVYAGYSCKS